MIINEEYLKLEKTLRQEHLDLTESCLERGGSSTNHKGVLAQYLNSSIPSGRILLCHACHNGKCSNPKHLYWGSDKDNCDDAIENKTRKSIYKNTIDKYGKDGTKKIASKAGIASGQSRIGVFLSDNHKFNISKALIDRKLSKTNKENISKSVSGYKNSQYGTMWITNGTENKKIKKVDIIPEGWYKGRNMHMHYT